jgi:hypothetical protein
MDSRGVRSVDLLWRIVKSFGELGVPIAMVSSIKNSALM